MVCFFLGLKPLCKDNIESLSKAWRLRPEFDVQPMSNDFLAFHFNSLEESQRVIEVGPLFVFGHPLFLKRWTPDLSLKFPKLKMIYRSKKSLLKIAISIGRLIYMDHHTAAGTRPTFARVLIEVTTENKNCRIRSILVVWVVPLSRKWNMYGSQSHA